MKDYNFPAFDEAAARGRGLGHEIISPAELDRAAGFSGKGSGKVDENGHNATVTIDYMRDAIHRDVAAIVGTPDRPGVNAVAMLPGWEQSRDANGERALALWLGLPILDAKTFKPLAAEPAEPAPIRNGEFVVKDSGERTTFGTGAVRDAAAGKGFYHCLPYTAIERLARLYEAGARKYGRDNWRKGIPLSRYIDAAFRHLFKLAAGWVDEDHGAAIMWNAAGFMWTAEQIAAGTLPVELNDIGFPIKPKEAA